MGLLLDTHVLLWALKGDAKLSQRARHCVADASQTRWVSIASAWEITIKVGLGKLYLPVSIHELVPAKLRSMNLEILGIQPRHLHVLDGLPPHHRDPFDRMLASQALAENLTLVSADAAFDAYDVKRFW
jgi:PIN domain nuclease of toxin-antitoxin system